jgi:predicted GIY-YIG superfamily endonuclease
MKNYKEELYPENLSVLLNYADEVAENILVNLNNKNAKSVCDLYSEVNGKIIRNKKVFDELGYTPNDSNEFKGLYIFGEEQNGKVIPVYVGISRSIFRRLKQHAWGKLHNECTLAYLKTKHQWEIVGKEAKRDSITHEDMLPAKEIIQNYKVVLVEVQNDYDLYFLEVSLAGIFNTKWNSFKTH